MLSPAQTLLKCVQPNWFLPCLKHVTLAHNVYYWNLYGVLVFIFQCIENWDTHDLISWGKKFITVFFFICNFRSLLRPAPIPDCSDGLSSFLVKFIRMIFICCSSCVGVSIHKAIVLTYWCRIVIPFNGNSGTGVNNVQCSFYHPNWSASATDSRRFHASENKFRTTRDSQTKECKYIFGKEW